MTFATLRALHAIIGAAIDDIERVYHAADADQRYPLSPVSPTSPSYSTASTSPWSSREKQLQTDWPPPSPTASIYSSTESDISIDDAPCSSGGWEEPAFEIRREKEVQIPRTKTPSPPSPVSPVTPSRRGRCNSATVPRTPGPAPSTPRRSGDTPPGAGDGRIVGGAPSTPRRSNDTPPGAEQDSPCTPRNRDDSPYVRRPPLRYAPHSPPGLGSSARKSGDTPPTPANSLASPLVPRRRELAPSPPELGSSTHRSGDTPPTPANSLASPQVPRRREPAPSPYVPGMGTPYSSQQSRRRIEVPYTPYAPHEHGYGQPRLPHSPPPTPASHVFPCAPLDYPALNNPFYPSEKEKAERERDAGAEEPETRARAEALTSHPAVIAASNRLVAACGQLSASIQRPFLTICDAAMGVRTLIHREFDSLG